MQPLYPSGDSTATDAALGAGKIVPETQAVPMLGGPCMLSGGENTTCLKQKLPFSPESTRLVKVEGSSLCHRGKGNCRDLNAT